MKSFLTLALVFFTAASLFAHSDHKKKVAGPHGGKVITAIEPHVELFVTAENKVQMTFLNEKLTAIPPAEQTISIICGERSQPTKLSFIKTETGFLSEQTLPDSKNFPAVIRIKITPDAKFKTLRLQMNLTDCPTCDYKEYACTCDHHHGHDHDHDKDHKH